MNYSFINPYLLFLEPLPPPSIFVQVSLLSIPSAPTSLLGSRSVLHARYKYPGSPFSIFLHAQPFPIYSADSKLAGFPNPGFH